MRELGLQGIYPKKKCNTTIADKENKIYPYLLKDLEIVRINQVWTSDITYIWVAGRFMYFIAIIDLHSRYIVASGLNHSLEGDFCVFILNLALEGKKPEIFNTDRVLTIKSSIKKQKKYFFTKICVILKFITNYFTQQALL